MSYAELHAKTNLSFLEGASHPDELVCRAAELGLAALAVTDRNSLAGVVRAYTAARDLGFKLHEAGKVFIDRVAVHTDSVGAKHALLIVRVELNSISDLDVKLTATFSPKTFKGADQVFTQEASVKTGPNSVVIPKRLLRMSTRSRLSHLTAPASPLSVSGLPAPLPVPNRWTGTPARSISERRSPRGTTENTVGANRSLSILRRRSTRNLCVPARSNEPAQNTTLAGPPRSRRPSNAIVPSRFPRAVAPSPARAPPAPSERSHVAQGLPPGLTTSASPGRL